jgi:TRAP-type C4-dicarboxylate transport system permease small subunit
MVGSSFFGAASALARSENLGVAFFIDMLPGGIRRAVDATGALLVTIIAGYVAYNGIKMGWLTGKLPAPDCRWSGPLIRWGSARCS